MRKSIIRDLRVEDDIPHIFPPTRVMLSDNIHTDEKLENIFSEAIKEEIMREVELNFKGNVNDEME